MAEPSTYQSLYRRYRSQRFDQVLGQDHVTKALRNAVRDGRVGHAYLFSGPRGTGKTSTARILAKVLNCAAPEDGEPCGKCENCLAVERGQDTDWLLEQDAASKSKVDDMRDLLDRVPLGTSGNRKVIILDEVHMLSQGAENALLKTLEEPPAHVVFVLATTDPQKVRPTIRSRTQHFEFHLLSASVLAEHVRWVISDAQLQLPADEMDRIVDHVVRLGGGSARDTLSALDQVAALGEVSSAAQPVDSILDALAAEDAGGVLTAVSEATATGREPRALGEAIIVRLRDAFLAVLGAAGDHLPPAEQERALQLGKQMGPARLTRALDVLGEALTELARKPDPRIVVEVALVRLAQPQADSSVASLVARIEALERAIQTGAVAAPPADAGSSTSAPQPVQRSQPSASAEPDAAPQPQTQAQPPPPGASGAGADAARAALARQRAESGSSEPSSTSDVEQGSVEQRPGPRSKPTLGSVASRQGGSSAPETAPSSSAPADPSVVPDEPPHPAEKLDEVPATSGSNPDPSSVPEEGSGPEPAPSQAGSAAELPSISQLQGMWEKALSQLPVKVRSKWRGGRWHDVAGGQALFAVPNQWHQKACEEGQQVVEKVLAEQVGSRVPVKVIVEGDGPQGSGPAGGGRDPEGQGGVSSPSGGGGGPGSPPTKGPDSGGSLPGDDGGMAPPPRAQDSAPYAGTSSAGTGSTRSASPDDDDVHMAEIAELRDAGDVATGGIDLLMREFGGELIVVDPNQPR